LTLAGAKLIDVGVDDWAAGAGVRGIEPEIFAEAVTDRTAAIFYLARREERMSLKALVAVARRYGLPVIVDAAAQLPPRENLRRFIAEGADLVIFSGGKAIGGPQGTGILCGKRELVASAALQMVDLDVPWEAWNPPRLLFPKEALQGMPYHGIGRGFKVSKEEIVGLMVALRHFVDAEKRHDQMVGLLRHMASKVEGLAGVDKVRLVLDAPTPLLQIKLDEACLKRSPWEISTSLRYGNPRIAFNEQLLHQGILIVNPISLRAGDEEVVVQGLAKELASSLR
jgi:L-seryl-tRNA(Ser) seleniumtransferase